jgi:hypothetical protein
MINPSEFAKSYLAMQGIPILPQRHETRPIKERREAEIVGRVPDHQRGEVS